MERPLEGRLARALALLLGSAVQRLPGRCGALGEGVGVGMGSESQGRLVGIYTPPERACDLAALALRREPTE